MRLIALLVVAGCGSGDGNVVDASSDASTTDASSDVVAIDQDAGDGALPTSTELAPSVTCPCCLAVDATNLYYCSQSKVYMVPIAGGTPTLIASNPNQANNLSIAVSSNMLYVLDYQGSIGKVPLPGGGWSWLLQYPAGTPWRGLVLEGTTLYWVAQLAGKVMQMDIGGGTPTAVATSQASPAEITGDAKALFWVNHDVTNGAVMTLTLPPGTATPLVPSAPVAERVAIDANNVYYTAAGADTWMSLFQVPRAGGQAVELFGHDNGLPLGERCNAVTANGSSVFTAAGSGIYKVHSGGGGTRVSLDGTTEILADATNLYWVGSSSTTQTDIKKMPVP